VTRSRSWSVVAGAEPCHKLNSQLEVLVLRQAISTSFIDLNQFITMADSKPLVIKSAASIRSADGMVPINTWCQAPTPSTARPFQPSVVTWMRGMGEEEAKGVIAMEKALRAHDPNFYAGRVHASLAVIRAHQVLHQEEDIPADILANFGGQVPDMKGLHYYSLMQIVRSGPDCTRMVKAMETEAKKPYVEQLGTAFTASYTANNKLYNPTRETHEAVRKPVFVSAGAALAHQLKAAAAATAEAAAGSTTPTGAKRARLSVDNGSGITARIISPVDAVKAKATPAALQAVKQYIDACTSSGTPIDSELLGALNKI